MKRDSTDDAFSEAVRERDDWTCQRCGIVDVNAQMGGRPSFMDCSHIYSRKYISTRWHPDNALCLCKSCHRKMGDRPPEHSSLALGILGHIRYQELVKRRANNSIKYSKQEKKEITKHYREEFKKMKALRMQGLNDFDLVAWD